MPLMSSVRRASEAAISASASCAVERFEPETTKPPIRPTTAALIASGSKRTSPRIKATRIAPPSAMAIRAARMNLRQPSSRSESCSMRCSSSPISRWGSRSSSRSSSVNTSMPRVCRTRPARCQPSR